MPSFQPYWGKPAARNGGFPDLAHDDEVDACAGALERLNPQMKSYGIFEYYRQEAERLRAAHEDQDVRVADATGIPLEAEKAQASADFRTALGLDRFGARP